LSEIRWTDRAADLKTIADYLFERSPRHAARTVNSIYESASSLVDLPLRGRQKKKGTRELVLAPLPYVSIYRIHRDAIHIVKILDGAQKWP
jgi:plasmid stabilization system protein ParE